ncbi:hypothetical protein V8C35DRAFT_151324 [Trichoderma chlorosporum]
MASRAACRSLSESFASLAGPMLDAGKLHDLHLCPSRSPNRSPPLPGPVNRAATVLYSYTTPYLLPCLAFGRALAIENKTGHHLPLSPLPLPSSSAREASWSLHRSPAPPPLITGASLLVAGTKYRVAHGDERRCPFQAHRLNDGTGHRELSNNGPRVGFRDVPFPAYLFLPQSASMPMPMQMHCASIASHRLLLVNLQATFPMFPPLFAMASSLWLTAPPLPPPAWTWTLSSKHTCTHSYMLPVCFTLVHILP